MTAPSVKSVPKTNCKRPDVSIVIPCFNRKVFASEAVASALNQKDVNIEVIIADDGSTDGTCEHIKGRFPEVKVLDLPHRGAGAARNAGLETATGVCVKFLDSDDLLAPDHLVEQISFADSNSADVCYGDWEFFGNLQAKEVGGNPRRIMGEPDDIITALLESWWGPPSIYLIRRAFLIEQRIRWDETLKRNQDMDFILHIAMHGPRIRYLSKLVSQKRVHDQGMIMDSGPDIYGRHCEIIADKTLAALRKTGRLTEQRKQAVADLYWHASRLLWEVSRQDYDRVVDKIKTLFPKYIPCCPIYTSPKMRILVNCVGLRWSENLYRATRSFRSFTSRIGL